MGKKSLYVKRPEHMTSIKCHKRNKFIPKDDTDEVNGVYLKMFIKLKDLGIKLVSFFKFLEKVKNII